MKLVIGDKNLSSWSMRAWLAAKASKLQIEEILIPLDQPQTKTEIQKWSPSGRVPCLIDGDLQIWDSLAICEYLAELSDQKLWPKNPKERALARAYVSEMHSGFPGLRSQLSMDLRLKIEVRHLTAQTIADIERILFLWTQALKKSKGPFLFGEFGIVDAFYAPVVFRFLSYGIQIKSEMIRKYMAEIQSHKHVKNWYKDGLAEKPNPIIFK